jgi:hypothetical protein
MNNIININNDTLQYDLDLYDSCCSDTSSSCCTFTDSDIKIKGFTNNKNLKYDIYMSSSLLNAIQNISILQQDKLKKIYDDMDLTIQNFEQNSEQNIYKLNNNNDNNNNNNKFTKNDIKKIICYN